MWPTGRWARGGRRGEAGDATRLVGPCFRSGQDSPRACFGASSFASTWAVRQLQAPTDSPARGLRRHSPSGFFPSCPVPPLVALTFCGCAQCAVPLISLDGTPELQLPTREPIHAPSTHIVHLIISPLPPPASVISFCFPASLLRLLLQLPFIALNEPTSWYPSAQVNDPAVLPEQPMRVP